MHKGPSQRDGFARSPGRCPPIDAPGALCPVRIERLRSRATELLDGLDAAIHDPTTTKETRAVLEDFRDAAEGIAHDLIEMGAGAPKPHA